MKATGNALIKVMGRLLISLALLFVVALFVFLAALLAGDSRWLFVFSFYVLVGWTLMPLIFLNTATTSLSSAIWIGFGLHAYTYISPGSSPKLFPYWCASTVAVGVLLLARFCLQSASQQDNNPDASRQENGHS